ncbi:MAG: carboxypeptidase M32, partial [bacterium]|nr:carboxypeptidase M32 [bacterium]
MSPKETYAALKKQMREIALLDSTGEVIYWDREAYLPTKGSDHRADQLAQISRLTHDWFVDPKVGDQLSEIESSDLVKDPESEIAVNCREWRRTYDRQIKLPSEFVEDFTRTTSKATAVWADARKKSDFKIFQPHLEKIVELCRQKADLIGYETERYDALLDEYEPGAKVSEVEKAFEDLRKELVTLIAKIKDAPRKPDIDIIKRPWNVDRQRIFSETVAVAMGYDFEAGRLDDAVHPMCSSLGPYDTRIFSRYYPEDLVEGLSGVMHEAGHALYDQSHPVL